MRATRIIQDHREELNRLAEALLEHETLSKDEIVSVCRGEKLNRSILSESRKVSNADEEQENEKERNENGRIIKTRGFTIFFRK